MVGHTFLYNPAIEMVKRSLEENNGGPIYYLYS